MADSPSTPPAPAPTEKTTLNRSPLNQAQLEAISKAESLCGVARKTEYAPKLATREIDDAFLDQLVADIMSARAGAGTAVGGTAAKEGATQNEDDAEAALVIALQEVQAAAKQKFSRTTPAKLKDYFIGERLNASRAKLEQYAGAIIAKAGADALPGITPAKITALQALLKNYKDTDAAQAGAQADATGARATLKAQVQSITDRRIQIQYAADAEWPYTNPENAGIRREFGLSPSQPFNG